MYYHYGKWGTTWQRLSSFQRVHYWRFYCRACLFFAAIAVAGTDTLLFVVVGDL